MAKLVQLLVIVKPFRAMAVLNALQGFTIHEGWAREVMGFGRQKQNQPFYLGSEFRDSFLPKVQIGLIVPESEVDRVVRAIVAQGRTGRMGDGKILRLECFDSDPDSNPHPDPDLVIMTNDDQDQVRGEPGSAQ